MVEKLQQEYSLEVDWRPFYLRPDTPPEGMDLPDYIKRARAGGSEERLRGIAESYDIPYAPTPRIFNTRLAHESTEYARTQGRLEQLHRILFRQVFADSLDIGRWDVLRSAAEEAALDAGEMQRQVEAGIFSAAVAGQVQNAYRIGVTGVPTYVINDRYAIVGAQPYAVFQQALSRILQPKN